MLRAPSPPSSARYAAPDESDYDSHHGLLTHREPGDLGDFPPAPPAFARDYPGEFDSYYDDDYPPPPGPDRGKHRHSHSPRRRPWVRVIGWIGAIIGLLVVSVAGYGYYEYRKVSGNITRVDVLATHDKSIKQAAKQLNAENFLIVGSDSREGANSAYGVVAGERSDTTILVHLSPDRNKATLVSFPRDSYVAIPSCTRANGTQSQPQHNLFNSAFMIGGASCTIRTVQAMTGVSITHYIQVRFDGFKSMVDALDGVGICSPTAVYDKDSGLHLAKGDQKLGGEQALAYVRARHGLGDGSDLGRIQRQQRFVGALIRKLTSSKLLFNPLSLARFLNAATKSLTLDKKTSFGDLKKLADQLRGLDPKKVSFLTAPIANRDYSPPGTSMTGKVLLDEVAGQRLWDAMINDKATPVPTTATPSTSKKNTSTQLTVAPADVSVQVLNGVGTAGLASTVKDALVGVGFTSAGTGNGDLGTVKSIVSYPPSKLAAARTLAAAVPGSVLDEDSTLTNTLVLTVGSNYSGVAAVKVGDTVANPAKAAKPTVSTSPVPSINAADTTCSN